MLAFDREYLTGGKKGGGLQALAEQIEYVVKKYGPDFIGIGTDYGGSGLHPPDDLKNAEKFPEITYTLLKRGVKEEYILKFLGGNLLHVMNDVKM